MILAGEEELGKSLRPRSGKKGGCEDPIWGQAPKERKGGRNASISLKTGYGGKVSSGQLREKARTPIRKEERCDRRKRGLSPSAERIRF